jgi:outer membrane protein insertion porin family
MSFSSKYKIWLLSPLVTLMILAVLAQGAQGYDVSEVQISGNQAFSQRQIKGLMRTKGSSWYKKRPFIRRVLELDVASIEAFYHKNGFLDCSLTVEELPSEERGSLTVQIHIQEGLRTVIAEVLFSGNERLSPGHLQGGIATQVGRPLDVTQLRLDARAVAAKYGDAGFPYARITADVEREGTQAQVKFNVWEGPPVHIGRIRYLGLRKVKTFVVRRELTFGPGDRYDRSTILDSQQRIYSTGLFSYANVQLEREAGDSLRPDIGIKLQERPMRWLGLKTDVGQDEQYDMTSDVTLEWGHKNLFARGQKLSLRAIASFRVFTEWENLKNRFEITHTEPWFLGWRLPASVSLYYEPGLRSKGRSYRVQRFGGRFNLSRELTRFSRAWLAFKYERVDIFGLDPKAAEILREASGVSIRRYLSLSWERDSRDHIFEPVQGSLSQVFTEFVGGPLGGDDHFVKAVVAWNRYQLLFPPAILASRMKLGWTEEHGQGQEVPPDARFYAGGATTVRGLAERSLGSMDPAGNPLGGKGLLLFNLELRRSLWRRLGGSLFWDLGNIWTRPRRANLRQLWSSAGMELWFSTPVGPVRLAYGVPLRKKLEKTKGKLHIAILFAF